VHAVDLVVQSLEQPVALVLTTVRVTVAQVVRLLIALSVSQVEVATAHRLVVVVVGQQAQAERQQQAQACRELSLGLRSRIALVELVARLNLVVGLVLLTVVTAAEHHTLVAQD
jgi:hypothetical protein